MFLCTVGHVQWIRGRTVYGKLVLWSVDGCLHSAVMLRGANVVWPTEQGYWSREHVLCSVAHMNVQYKIVFGAQHMVYGLQIMFASPQVLSIVLWPTEHVLRFIQASPMLRMLQWTCALDRTVSFQRPENMICGWYNAARCLVHRTRPMFCEPRHFLLSIEHGRPLIGHDEFFIQYGHCCRRHILHFI